MKKYQSWKCNKKTMAVICVFSAGFNIYNYISLSADVRNYYFVSKLQTEPRVLGSKFVGLANFKRFFNLPNFKNIFLNTLLLSLYNIAVSFPLPVILALSLNRAGNGKFKKNSADNYICAAFYFNGSGCGNSVYTFYRPILACSITL